ncbi:casein kinase I [Pyrus ussuriensis x Pyrus communis]|uniref:non-specific serine/threonine protein kinase n=1 Tax=Pyrus ussuriensis x Pyrus communis TaxID=2448454 RepID=A0A5N5H987_9ROSA|nr:casein kinase I [Pyrus ussuriensis x Pyrus communis]
MESVVGGNGWFDRKSRPVVNGRFRVGPIIRFSQFGASREFFTCCSKKFSLKTVLMLAEKMINRVEFVHSKSFLHQDVKPENFLFGAIKQPNEVLSICYFMSCVNTSFIPDGKKWKHNVAYSSINAHRGVGNCRDDLESLGYVLTYFLRGSLPWQEVSASTREEEFEMCEIKESISIEELCRGYPKEFAAYLNYCRSLRFDEKPDYAYLRKLFRRYRRDLKYDWVRNPACLLSEEGIVVARRLYRKVVPYCPRNKNAGPVIKHCN